jgi:pimeloyl-ACP methyl ester carboxylesterase
MMKLLDAQPADVPHRSHGQDARVTVVPYGRSYPLDTAGHCSIIADYPPRTRPTRGTIVLLASMLVRPRSYSRLVQRLTRTSRVITIEPPGTGCASKLRRPWRFEDYADYLLHALEKLDVADVTLIGHSNSAAVAMIMGGKVDPAATSRIGRIVLADSVGGDPRHNFWRIGLARLADGTLEPGFSMTALYDVFFNLIAHHENFLEEIDQAIHWDAGKFAPHVRVPTLVATGGLDLTFRPWAAWRLHEMIPASQFVLFDRGSHDWLATHPHEFATMVECFVEQAVRRRRVDNLAAARDNPPARII